MDSKPYVTKEQSEQVVWAFQQNYHRAVLGYAEKQERGSTAEAVAHLSVIQRRSQWQLPAKTVPGLQESLLLAVEAGQQSACRKEPYVHVAASQQRQTSGICWSTPKCMLEESAQTDRLTATNVVGPLSGSEEIKGCMVPHLVFGGGGGIIVGLLASSLSASVQA